MATTNAVTSVVDWVRPSVIAEEAGKLLRQGPGIEDCLEAIINGLEWAGLYGNETAKEWVEDLEPINQGLAVPSFFSSLGRLRNDFITWIDGGKGVDGAVNVFNSTLKTVKDGSKSTLFLDTINVISLKDSVKIVKGAIWGSLFFLDGISFFDQVGEAQRLREKMESLSTRQTSSTAAKIEIIGHKIKIAYLNVLKAVNSIALASIALVSILFASIAHGLIFSPVVFLSLTSSWLVLNFVTHFYEKMVDHWNEERKAPIATRA